MKLETGNKQPDAIALFKRRALLFVMLLEIIPKDPYSVFMEKKPELFGLYRLFVIHY